MECSVSCLCASDWTASTGSHRKDGDGPHRSRALGDNDNDNDNIFLDMEVENHNTIPSGTELAVLLDDTDLAQNFGMSAFDLAPVPEDWTESLDELFETASAPRFGGQVTVSWLEASCLVCQYISIYNTRGSSLDLAISSAVTCDMYNYFVTKSVYLTIPQAYIMLCYHQMISNILCKRQSHSSRHAGQHRTIVSKSSS